MPGDSYDDGALLANPQSAPKRDPDETGCVRPRVAEVYYAAGLQVRGLPERATENGGEA